MRYTFTLLFSLFVAFVSQAQNVFTLGPMLHYNIGKNIPNKLSYGLEAAYWNLDNVPVGFDLGLEFQKGAKRVYLEGQVGAVLAGLAAGPVLEKKNDEPMHVGWQTNIWANYFVGANLRWRRINKQSIFAPGIYAKYPFLGSGLNNGSDGDTDWDDLFD